MVAKGPVLVSCGHKAVRMSEEDMVDIRTMREEGMGVELVQAGLGDPQLAPLIGARLIDRVLPAKPQPALPRESGTGRASGVLRAELAGGSEPGSRYVTQLMTPQAQGGSALTPRLSDRPGDDRTGAGVVLGLNLVSLR